MIASSDILKVWIHFELELENIFRFLGKKSLHYKWLILQVVIQLVAQLEAEKYRIAMCK